MATIEVHTPKTTPQQATITAMVARLLAAGYKEVAPGILRKE